MSKYQERILIIENDPETRDLIANQTLLPLGYKLRVISSSSSAIQNALKFSPDLVIVNLSLSELSGKDLLVAFSSQEIDVPVVVIADEFVEGDIIDSFRLGAADFITLPIREAEVVSVVERVLGQVRSRREKEQLAERLNQTNAELHQRVRELTTILGIGKAVISITDLSSLFKKIVEGAVFISEADCGWLLLRDESKKDFILRAGLNLSDKIASKLNQPWDDGLSSLVASSGESLSIHGKPLKRFKFSVLGQSALVVPIKIKHEVVGLLEVARRSLKPFSESNQALLEALSDYASIAIVNARLFQVLSDRFRTSQQIVDAANLSGRIYRETTLRAGAGMQKALSEVSRGYNLLFKKPGPATGREYAAKLESVKTILDKSFQTFQIISKNLLAETRDHRTQPDLNELVRQSVQRFQSAGLLNRVTVKTEFSPFPVWVAGSIYHLSKAVDGLIANMLINSSLGAQIHVQVKQAGGNLAQLAIRDPERRIPKSRLSAVFNEPVNLAQQGDSTFGLGISLKLVGDIIQTLHGKVWVESDPLRGCTFFILLPCVDTPT